MSKEFGLSEAELGVSGHAITAETSEQKEKKDNSFEARYEKLAQESRDLTRDREITFRVANLQSEGLQTLIDIYGIEKVFKTIKDTFKSSGKETFSTFEIVKQLEPDLAKRTGLFDKMLSDAGEQEQRAHSREDGTPNEQLYYEAMYGFAGNFTRVAKSKIAAMKNLDSILGKVMPQRHYKVLGSGAEELAAYVSQHESEEQRLLKQLTEAGSNIFQLVEQREKASIAQTEQLRSETQTLVAELKGEIQRITNELNAGLEEWRAKVLQDLAKVGLLKTGTQEMQSALEEALQKVEAQISKRVDAVEKQIQQQTAPLQELTSRVETLRLAY